MRLIRVIIVLVAAQLLVAALVAVFTYMEYVKEREQMIHGDLLTLTFMTMGKRYDKSFRRALLDVGPGMVTNIREGEFPPRERPDFSKINIRSVDVTLAEDLDRDSSPELYNIFQSPRNLVLKESGDEIWVAAKLYRPGEDKPYGVIRIINHPRGLLHQIINRNTMLYLLIFVLVNGQAALLLALISRRREVVFQKGYLKEHALGALKLHHKIIGDIIADHKENGSSSAENKAEIVSFPGESR